MLNNVSSMIYALKSVPSLADVGVLHGDGDGPRTPPRCLEGARKKFQLTILLCLTTSLIQSILKNQSLAVLTLRSPMGIGMAPELQPDVREGGHEKVSNDSF